MKICEIVPLRSALLYDPLFCRELDLEPFFSSPDWFELVAHSGLHASTRAFLAIDDRHEVALALLQVKPTGELRSCSALYTCEFRVLGASPTQEAVRNLAKEVSAGLRPSYIRLEGLDPSGPSFGALREGFDKSGYLTKSYFAWGNWYEKVEDRGLERYLAKRPSVLMNTWRRKRISAEKFGAIDVRQWTQGDDVEEYIGTYQSVQRASWKAAEPLPHFIPNLIRLAAAKSALRMGVLNIGGRPAAAQFWIVSKAKALIFKLVYGKEFARFSPGTLLTMHMVRTILETDKPEEIDFGRGDDPYKRLWVNSRRERWGIEAANLYSPRGLIHASRLSAGLARASLRRFTSGRGTVKPSAA